MEKQYLINFGFIMGNYKDFISHIIQLAIVKQSAIEFIAKVHVFVETRRNDTYQNVLENADIIKLDDNAKQKIYKIYLNSYP